MPFQCEVLSEFNWVSMKAGEDDFYSRSEKEPFLNYTHLPWEIAEILGTASDVRLSSHAAPLLVVWKLSSLRSK
jgi:hypothetical protein